MMTNDGQLEVDYSVDKVKFERLTFLKLSQKEIQCSLLV